jgi:hypothetical protein
MASTEDRYPTKSDAPGAEPTEKHDTPAEGSAALIDPATAAVSNPPTEADGTAK